MKTTVVHHSADYDGIFCREIARKFLPDAELIGWDFGDNAIEFKEGQQWYVLDLPVDRVFGWDFLPGVESSENDKRRLAQIVWIDHHKSSIASHPTDIPGYRIDGVAACRLAWQWFNFALVDIDPAIAQKPGAGSFIPSKEDFVNRTVSEPLAVRLAGEYDIWDHRDQQQDVMFQFGLDSEETIHWEWLLDQRPEYAQQLVAQGKCAMACYKKRDADVMRSRSFMVNWEGLKFLALTTARCNSNTFAAKDVPETGHDALMAFFYNGSLWTISLYHANHRKDIDLSMIATKYGGGGHRGACGMAIKNLPFLA